MRSDKLSEVISLESLSAGAEDYKFENGKQNKTECRVRRSDVITPL